MKKIKIFLAVILALTLTACSDASKTETGEPLIAETTSELLTEAPPTETTAKSATIEETVTLQVTTEEEIIATLDTEETASEDENDITSKFEFFDYKFIENYQGTTEIGKLADKAAAFLMESEYYSEAMENTDKFSLENLKNLYSEEFAENLAKQFAEYFDNNGKIVPKLNIAYPEDYDGDGTSETFMIVDMPCFMDYPSVQSFFIFADSSENITILAYNSNIYDTILLDYGKFKQITFGGFGSMGASDHTALFGLKDGKAVMLYDERCSYIKSDCFLSIFGWMGMGEVMFFNTETMEYCTVSSVEAEVDDIRAMDTSNSLSDIWDSYNEGDFLHFVLIGQKYYCAVESVMGIGEIYTYENGSFEHVENPTVLTSKSGEGTYDIDMNRAIAKMKSVK